MTFIETSRKYWALLDPIKTHRNIWNHIEKYKTYITTCLEADWHILRYKVVGRPHTVSILGHACFHFQRRFRGKVSTHFGALFCNEINSLPPKTWTKGGSIFGTAFSSRIRSFSGPGIVFLRGAVRTFVSLIKRFLADFTETHIKHIKTNPSTVKHILPYWTLWGLIETY